jgi:Spy/CpxP family protein refolding chaperone
MKSVKGTVVKRIGFLLVSAFLCIAGSAHADPAPGAGGRADVEQRMHKARARLLRERVGLSEAKAQKVESVLDKYAPERKRLLASMRDARQKLRALVTLKSDDQNAYRTNLDELRKSRQGLLDLMQKAFTEVSKDLSPKEQALLYLALDKVRMKFRDEMMQRPRLVDDDDPGY